MNLAKIKNSKFIAAIFAVLTIVPPLLYDPLFYLMDRAPTFLEPLVKIVALISIVLGAIYVTFASFFTKLIQPLFPNVSLTRSIDFGLYSPTQEGWIVYFVLMVLIAVSIFVIGRNKEYVFSIFKKAFDLKPLVIFTPLLFLLGSIATILLSIYNKIDDSQRAFGSERPYMFVISILESIRTISWILFTIALVSLLIVLIKRKQKN